MPVPVWNRPAGRIVEIVVHSDILADNRLGDPAERVVAVYLPQGYDESGADYPLFVDLIGYTGSGFSHLNWKPFEESVPQRIDRLVAEGKMGPVICAFPDTFTALGGNQHIDSVVMGRWATWLTEALIPTLEREFRVRRGRENRAVFGKSSGGYGAIVHALKYAEHWGAAACHSGDMGFEWCYHRYFAPTLDRLARTGWIDGFMKQLRASPKVNPDDLMVLCTLAMAASYDPDPTAPWGVRLPVDASCRMIPERWARWLEHDPVELVERPEYQANLRSLKGLYIDCGDHDQYFLHYGSRQLTKRLTDLKIPHTYAEFDDDHSGVDYRMDESLPFLYRTIAT